MYFEGSESKEHLFAKEKLFDLIVQKRVKILDEYGTEYEIFTGKHDEEFLHIESFVMDYSDDVLFSNTESPCKKYMESKGFTGCDMKGYFGAYKELPCEKCVMKNYGKYMTQGNKYASYRPDVSFGYGGKHKVWFEIENTNPCSKNKIEFCKKKGIVLLEINSRTISEFEDFEGKLVFKRLEQYEYKYNFYSELDKLPSHIHKTIEENGFATYDDVFSFFTSKSDNHLSGRNLYKIQNCVDGIFCKIENYNLGLIEHFNLDPKKKIRLIVRKEDYDELMFIENDYIPSVFRKLEKEFGDMLIEIKQDCFPSASIEKVIKDKAPKGHKQGIKFDEWYEKFGFVKVLRKTYYKKLKDIGITTDSKHSKIVISKDVLLKIN